MGVRTLQLAYDARRDLPMQCYLATTEEPEQTVELSVGEKCRQSAPVVQEGLRRGSPQQNCRQPRQENVLVPAKDECPGIEPVTGAEDIRPNLRVAVWRVYHVHSPCGGRLNTDIVDANACSACENNEHGQLVLRCRFAHFSEQSSIPGVLALVESAPVAASLCTGTSVVRTLG